MAGLSRLCYNDVLFKVRVYTARYLHGHSLWKVDNKRNDLGPDLIEHVDKDNSLENVSAIVIPSRKKKDHLSVLQALSRTVKNDFSSPHYLYIDDPFLIPTTPIQKKMFALSYASGKKAAHFFVDDYPEYFTNIRVPEEPKISALSPKNYRFSENDELGLLERIEHRLPIESYNCFTNLQSLSKIVSSDVQDDLLELLCVYNGVNPESRHISEDKFIEKDKDRRRITSTWNQNGIADKLFDSMEVKSDRAYNAIIRGKARCYQANQAYDIFVNGKQLGVNFTLKTYNALFRITSFIHDKFDLRWQQALDFLKDMKDGGVTPNLDTFNSVLFMLSRSVGSMQCSKKCSMVLSEMRSVGLNPTLASWCYVLQITYNKYNTRTDNVIFRNVLDELESNQFVMTHPDDFEFFSTAMLKCFILKDIESAYRLDKILNSGENYIFLGDGHSEGTYYNYFLKLLCLLEPLEDLMKQYKRITPYAFIPMHSTMEQLMQAIDLNNGYEYLCDVWEDLKLYNYINNEKIVGHLVEIAAKKCHEPVIQSKLVSVTEDIVLKYEFDMINAYRNPFVIDGEMVGDMIIINLYANELDNAWKIFKLYYNNCNTINKFPSELSLNKLMKSCIEDGQISRCVDCLVIMSNCAYSSLEENICSVKVLPDITEEQKIFIESL